MKDSLAPQVLGVLAGMAIGLVTTYLAIWVTGGCCSNPGNPMLGRRLFPYSVLMDDRNGATMVFQMSFYGLMLGRVVAGKKDAPGQAILLAVLHGIAIGFAGGFA